MRRIAFAAATLCAAAVVLARPATAQEQPSDTLFTVAKYLDYETVGEPQISRDGTQIVYTRRWVNKIEDKWESALWIMNADGSRNRFLTKGSNPVWSPDGTRIAYLAEGEPKGTQLFVRYMDASGNSTQITRVSEAPSSLHWSPDGKSIGFAMNVPAPEDWKISLPAAPEGAKWTKAPRYVSSLHYRQDRVGYTDRGFTHLFVVGADGGTPRQVTSGDWSIGYIWDGQARGIGWDWLPDGKSVIVESLKDGVTDYNYRDCDLYLVDVATGTTTKLTTTPGSWSNPVVSPDGKTVAFIGFPRTDDTYKVADLWTMPATGGPMSVRTASLDRDPSSMAWTPDGSGVYFTADDRGSSNLFLWNASGTHAVTSGPQLLRALSIAKTGTAVLVRSAASQPTDVVTLALGGKKPSSEPVQLTHVNDDLLERVKLASIEEIWYRSTNDTKVQAWIVKPPHFDPSKHYPMVLEIHGGPHGMYDIGFNPMFQNFAANGYVVLYVNPRGSTGYGSAFGNAIKKRYPGVDVDDLLSGVDTVLGRGYVDSKRLYVSGCSGGGVLSSWIIGHTDRFAAAAVRCPVTDWLSFAGETDIPYFTYQFFDKPFWEDPMAWLKQSSLMYVGNVKTPTVIMTGVLDMRTPMPQSEAYYSALKFRHVPSALLRFEGEYHGTGSKPSNWMRTQLYMMSWFAKYTGEKKDVSLR